MDHSPFCGCSDCPDAEPEALNQCFRFSYQCPTFSRTGKLSGWELHHIAHCAMVSRADYIALFEGRCEVFFRTWNGPEGMKKRLAKSRGYTDEQAALMRYTGVSVATCFPGETIPVIDARWI